MSNENKEQLATVHKFPVHKTVSPELRDAQIIAQKSAHYEQRGAIFYDDEQGKEHILRKFDKKWMKLPANLRRLVALGAMGLALTGMIKGSEQLQGSHDKWILRAYQGETVRHAVKRAYSYAGETPSRGEISHEAHRIEDEIGTKHPGDGQILEVHLDGR